MSGGSDPRRRRADPARERNASHMASSVPVHGNWIAGKWVPARSEPHVREPQPRRRHRPHRPLRRLRRARRRRTPSTSPPRRTRRWRLVPGPQRGEILYRLGEILRDRKEQYARDMTREMGKVLKEARGDVQEAIDMAFLMGGEGRRLHGQTTPSELPNKFAMSVRSPIGVCAFITPWNFPMAIPAWKIDGRARLREHGRHQAGDGHAALGRELRARARGRGPSARRLQRGHGQRLEGRDAAPQGPARQGRLVHRLDVRRADDQRGVRADVQARPPRDGRQEPDHRDGRREPRARGRRRDLGRVRDERPALHGVLAPPRPQQGRPEVHGDARRARERRCKVGNGLDEKIEMGPSINESQLDTVLDYISIGKAEGAKVRRRRPAPRGQGATTRAGSSRPPSSPTATARCASRARRSSGP